MRRPGFTLLLAVAAFVLVAFPSSPLSAADPPAFANPRLTGTPLISMWDSDTHGGAPGNYYVVQHPQTGFMYLGNPFGLIEYDGATWRLIPFRDEGAVPIAVIDGRGSVWMGGANEIAVLQPDSRGELQPVEVTDRLPVAERNFGRLHLGTAAPDGVYFASPSRLVFFGHDGTARSWPAGSTNFNGLSWLDGALHVSKAAAGLVRLEGGAFVSVAPAPRSSNPAMADLFRVFTARAEPGGAGRLLLTNLGPMRWAGRGAPLEALSAAALAEFDRESAKSAAFLSDGRLAFSFRLRGLLILEANGAVSARLDPAQGFSSGQIDHLAADNQGGLWLARTNSLARLQIDSRFATQGAFNGARAFLRHGQRLYVSQNAGVHWRNDATGRAHPVSDLPYSPTTLFSVGDRLFCTGQFLREITPDDHAVDALRLSFYDVAPLRDAPGTFVGASVAGLRLLRFDGAGWRDAGLVSSVRGSVRHVLEDREGYIWAVGYGGSGSWRVDFRSGAGVTAPAEYFDDARGLPFVRGRDATRFIALGGETLATRAGALLRYDRAAVRFVREDRLESTPALDDVVIAPGAGKDLWWFSTSPAPQFVHLVPAAENRWRAETLSAGPLHGFAPTALYYDPPTRTIWLGGRGGAPLSIDADWHPAQPPAPLRATVRRLTTATGELLWASSGSESGSLNSPPPTLNSSQNSLRFAFAAPAFLPDFRGAIRTVYRTRLEGLEETWTTWSPTPWREFSHLPYRNFVFRVQARDIDDRESSVGTLAFAIAPPWFLTRWALSGYVLSAIAGIAGLFRYRTRALRRRNAQLESLVAARTAELATQNAELARIHQIDRDENASLRLAEERARLELLRYQLNPHFLLNAFTTLRSVVFSSPAVAGRMVERLADFCRLALTRSDNDGGTVGDEVALLESYLDTEKILWRDELQVTLEVASDVRDRPMPPFLLQPLVENAIKYGSRTSPGRLQVRICIAANAAGLAIEIANTGAWVGPDSPHRQGSTGIGFDNLRQRLRRYYRDAHEFTTQEADGWVVVRLRLGAPGLPAPG